MAGLARWPGVVGNVRPHRELFSWGHDRSRDAKGCWVAGVRRQWRSARCLAREQTAVGGKRDKLSAGVGIELGQERGDVVLDRAGGDKERPGDLFVGAA